MAVWACRWEKGGDDIKARRQEAVASIQGMRRCCTARLGGFGTDWIEGGHSRMFPGFSLHDQEDGVPFPEQENPGGTAGLEAW